MRACEKFQIQLQLALELFHLTFSSKITERVLDCEWLHLGHMYAFNPTQNWIALLKRETAFKLTEYRYESRTGPLSCFASTNS
jgi:hypothetical protein